MCRALPGVSTTIVKPSELTFAAVVTGTRLLARLRGGRRVLHPAGRSFTGELEISGGTDTGVPLLDEPGRYPATVRLSKATPTPGGWPDVFGLAVRVHDLPDGPFDLLMSSSTGLPVLRHVFLPRGGFAGPYSSLVGYRTPRGRVTFGARAAGGAWLGSKPADLDDAVSRGAVRFTLATATGRGWARFGRLTLEQRLDDRADAELAFDPAGHDLPELRLTGPLRWARAATYRGSQRGRATHPRANVGALRGSDYSSR